jgi:hypothetical protein
MALVLMRFNQVASRIVNENHSIMRPALKLLVAYCITGCVRLAIPQPTEWQRIGNEIDTATAWEIHPVMKMEVVQ